MNIGNKVLMLMVVVDIGIRLMLGWLCCGVVVTLIFYWNGYGNNERRI